MKKFLIISGLAIAVLIALMFAAMYFMKKQTKMASPEESVVFTQGKLNINVFYNRPFKKGRVIYGGLVPYGKVWRTGANEATTFQTSQDLKFEGKILRKGKYSLWTIPGEDTWTIIFNSEYGQWGVSSDGEANRSADRDVLQVQVHPVLQDREFEQFTIAFEKMGEEVEMVFMWDKTVVAVPFAY
jgi:hypothetical protein